MAADYGQIIKYIDEHIKDEIKLDDITKLAGYSLPHLYRTFKIYSPFAIKEYIRIRKLYAAANELYSGRKIYDIALDYGYETPAGFFKAFQSVFGCSPSFYKNKFMKEGINMIIDNIKNIAELDEALNLIELIYPKLNISLEGDEKYSRNFWIKQFDKNPELLLYAKDNDKICGIILGWDDDGKFITVGFDGTTAEYKNKGVHEALFVEIEKRAKKLRFQGIVLGISEGEEEFYAKFGYIGRTLIQSEKHSIEELKNFNAQYKNYEVTGTNVYEGHINQLWLNVSLLDKELKKKYENELGDCWVQVIVSKNI
ncbi:MAG: GNAT family N-acetyltransferase [Saccharofermentanales bacterium]